VNAVGPGTPYKEGRVVPTAVQAGDRVLLLGWGGKSHAIKIGVDVRFVSLSECMGS
jgi:chaperonin GroES